ncbi:amino acid transporter AVT1C [Zea mays]|uniref:Transmembrane amino acid transporter family protein n=1 Tax=Zea mays TaxID=4577 RepID=A0A1D6MWS6_MAIZE|nr:amino acid transporter AVT1C [Zea mays]ONM33210.1 Transmembrane amino acid transporter family protein [Zea mays]|eukprot:XP_008674316.1 amino acid transporter AVT1C [Zea mays]
MDRDEEMGHGDRSLLFVGDEDDDIGTYRDGGFMETSSDEGSFSDPSDGEARGGRRGGDGSKSAWPQSYRQSIDMLSVVPSPTVSMLMAASPNLTRFGSSFLKAGSSFFLRKGDDSVLPLARPLLPPSLPQLSQSSLRPQPPMRQSTDILAQPPRPPAGHEAQLPDRPSSACLRPDYIELPPPASKCSRNQSIINGFNVLCGVGILSTSYGIKEGGWSSLLLLPLLGGSSCYTGLLLKRCIDSSPNIGTYPDIGQAAFGVAGRIFVSVVLYLELYASCVEYITLLGDSMSSVFPSAHLAFAGIDMNAHTLFAITTALAILPTVCLRNLSLLSYLSAGGVMATIAVIVCLFWVGIGEGIGFHFSGALVNVTHLPVALGLYGFCYSGHSVFPNIYSSMKERSQFPFVLLFCFTVVTVAYAGIAVSGFLMFGESTMSQFTLNLPQQYIPSKIAIWMTIVNPYTKYALTMTPVALSIEEALPKKMQNYLVGMSVRTCLVLSTVVVALLFPYFGLVMALLGSVFTMLVALILPCACYLSIKKGAVPLWEIILCIVIIMIGAVCASVGSYTSVSQMISSTR